MAKKRSIHRRKFISSTIIGVAGTLQSKEFIFSNKYAPFDEKFLGIIKGIVLGGSDLSIPHSQVQLVNYSTKMVNTVTSAYSGKFEFKDLQAGNYELSVPSMSGFTPLKVELQAGTVEDVILRIKKLKISNAFTKPRSITMSALRGVKTKGVSVVEVSDYVYGNYQGVLKSPPNADGNPKKAFIIFWKDFSYRFIFSHECSYCPFIEFPSGAGVCYQFFEGNEGVAELLNTPGRREKNTFIDVIEFGPDRVWLRWTYFGVNQHSGEQYYRGVEDFWAYPNGMIVRKQSFFSLKENMHGYAREPIELMGLCPVGKTWVDILKKNESSGEHHALTVLDTFSPKRYDVFWKHKEGTLYDAVPRRTGALWKELDAAAGIVLIMPLQEASPFCIFGDASGFRHDFTRIKDHSFPDTGGVGWVGQSWDHWPIGWLNSQTHEVDKDSIKEYPNTFSPAGMDFFALPNEEAEKGVYFSLIGVGNNTEAIRAVAKIWLQKGELIITDYDKKSGADLPAFRN